MTDNTVKHLEFIQNVITRMNTNSFLIKGWMITLVSALFALAAKDANVRYIMITYMAVPIFWILDSYYLSQERQYRELYNKVRNNDSSYSNFFMDASSFNNGKNTSISTIFSKTMQVL